MKTRIISAAIAIALAVPFVYFGGNLYAFGIGIVALLAFKEILDLKKTHKPMPFGASVVALIMYLFMIYSFYKGSGYTYSIIIALILGLLLPTLFYQENKYTIKDAFYMLGTILFLGTAFNCFLVVRSSGLPTFLYLVSIPIITDTAAYIFGCLLGKHKMCPTISPKKSWEGFFFGLGFGTVVPSILYKCFIGTLSFKIFLISAILSTMGQLGDLIFSKLKRENNIKDYSNLMPGHGGALDRLDSTIVIFMTYIFLVSVLF